MFGPIQGRTKFSPFLASKSPNPETLCLGPDGICSQDGRGWLLPLAVPFRVLGGHPSGHTSDAPILEDQCYPAKSIEIRVLCPCLLVGISAFLYKGVF